MVTKAKAKFLADHMMSYDIITKKASIEPFLPDNVSYLLSENVSSLSRDFVFRLHLLFMNN